MAPFSEKSYWNRLQEVLAPILDQGMGLSPQEFVEMAREVEAGAHQTMWELGRRRNNLTRLSPGNEPVPLYRFARKPEVGTPSSRPQGLFTIDNPNESQYTGWGKYLHGMEAYPDTRTLTFEDLYMNPGMSAPQNVVTGGRAEGATDSFLRGLDWWAEHAPETVEDPFTTYLRERFPRTNYDRMQILGSQLEAWGSELAREHGYDAIKGINPAWQGANNEVVLLNDRAVIPNSQYSVKKAHRWDVPIRKNVYTGSFGAGEAQQVYEDAMARVRGLYDAYRNQARYAAPGTTAADLPAAWAAGSTAGRGLSILGKILGTAADVTLPVQLAGMYTEMGLDSMRDREKEETFLQNQGHYLRALERGWAEPLGKGSSVQKKPPWWQVDGYSAQPEIPDAPPLSHGFQ